MQQQIQKLETWRKDLALAETFEEIRVHGSAAAAAAELARREKLSLEKQNEIGRFRIEVEAKKGEWLESNFPHGATVEKPRNTSFKLPDSQLKKMPTTPKESTRARKIAEKKQREPDTVNKVMDAIEKKGDVITPGKVEQEIRKQEKQTNLETKKQEYKQSTEKEIELKPKIKKIDCSVLLDSYDDNSIDCIMTDPPYFTDVKDIASFAKWVEIAIQKTKQAGRLYICTGAYPQEMQAYLNVFLSQDKFIVDNPLIWTYKNTLGQTPRMKYNLNYQLIWHLYSKETPELDISITNHMFSVQEINAPDGRLGDRLHTWQKPDELANRLVRQGTKENWLIVDPFACTGTFLLAAARQKRKSYGGDINIDNIQIALERGCEIDL